MSGCHDHRKRRRAMLFDRFENEPLAYDRWKTQCRHVKQNLWMSPRKPHGPRKLARSPDDDTGEYYGTKINALHHFQRRRIIFFKHIRLPLRSKSVRYDITKH